MARLYCPMCRLHLPAGATHCQRCGMRIAALPRRSRNRDVDAALDAAVDTGEDVGTALSVSRTRALLLGLASGVLLTGVAALIAVAVSRGHAFATAMSNAAFLVGGGTLTLAVALGGLRVSRWGGDIEAMKERARGEVRGAGDRVRLGVATAAGLPLIVAIALAATAH